MAIMMIDYNHVLNRHTVSGARCALSVIMARGAASSILDVGCGTGTWVRAAMDLGVRDVLGIDGIEIPRDELLFPVELFEVHNLNERWQLSRRFDMVIC